MSGKLIVIEGLDGSGKATQTDLLCRELSRRGIRHRHISFPHYESPSSALVKMYLAGEMGALDEVNVYAASSAYSLDRYVSFQRLWREDYESGGVIVADRYPTSNLCHQMCRLPRERWCAYIEWLTDYEYRLLALPEPNCVVYLDMHPEASRRLLTERYHGDESKKDLHERDFSYQLSCREGALFAADARGWQVLSCSDEKHSPRPIGDIAAEVAEAAFAALQ